MAATASQPTTPTLQTALRDAGVRLRDAGIATARLDANVLLGHVLGVGREVLLGYPERRLSDAESRTFAALVARRANREPVSHLVGRREFWSLDFHVDGSVLDPRPDSEALIEAVLTRVTDRNQPLSLLDLGTGSGCLLLSLLSELPAAWGVGIDASPAAVSMARRNARDLGLAGRAHFVAGDWGASLTGPFDIVVSNPPYIPSGDIAGLAPEVARFEPVSALDGGPDGLDCYRVLAGQLGRLCKDGGVMAVEHGAGQADAIRQLFGVAGLAGFAQVADLAGHQRCLIR